MYGLLAGLRVVEAASFIAAPSAALHLAQMGAEIIRIDQAGGGPDFRRWPLAPGEGPSLYWEGLNKGKKSVALDLSKPEGREIAAAIITAPGENAGLFVTNYPVAGFLAYENLVTRRSDLICLRIMGWPDGRPAVDYTVNAASGVPMMTGPSGTDGPVNHVLPAWDLLAGAYGAFALVAAERDRKLTGRGRDIRVPLGDVAIAAMGNLGNIAEAALTGQDRPRLGNTLFGAFGRDFLTRDGQRLMIVAITPRQWSGLVRILQLERSISDLEAELQVSFAKDESLRFIHRDRLLPLFEAAFAGSDSGPLIKAFEEVGVCWGPYQSLSEALANDAYFSASNPVLSDTAHPSGRYLTPGAAATIAGETRRAPARAPSLGADTEQVLTELLGFSHREISRLFDAKVIADAKGAGR